MPDDSLSGLADWIAEVQDSVERGLDACLPPADEQPAVLHAAMRYAVLGGGKRVRPLLVFAAGEVTGAAREPLVAVASAVELIHAYSLIHDDLPCMDDDVLRRNKPTVHVKFGEATALLAGDALQSLAFDAIALAPVTAEQVAHLVTLLAKASGSRGMAGGQAIDLESVGKPLNEAQLEQMHRAKTGALLRASVLMGAGVGQTGNVSIDMALDRYAWAVGLAFQVVDDILDVETSSEALGKTAGKDAKNNKPTYVSVLGMEQAKSMAGRLYDEAVGALEPLGKRAQHLAGLARFIVSRQH